HMLFFFFSSRRRHTRFSRDWSSDVCSSDLVPVTEPRRAGGTAARMALFVAGLASACGSPPSATAANRNPEPGAVPISASATAARSEERRVGEEGRAPRARGHGQRSGGGGRA